MSDCVLTLQLKGIEINSREEAERVLVDLVPDIAQLIFDTKNAPQSRGCSASGTVTHGPGGTSGSGTITCTF